MSINEQFFLTSKKQLTNTYWEKIISTIRITLVRLCVGVAFIAGLAKSTEDGKTHGDNLVDDKAND